MDPKKKTNRKLFTYKNTMTLAVILIVLTSFSWISSCNSHSKSKIVVKENKLLRSEVDSLSSIIENLPAELQEDYDWQIATFLYWERKADAPQYKNYTPKDYYDLINKK